MKRSLMLSAFLAALSTASAATEIRYGLWDSLQLPVYQQCAAAFQKQNPDITVKIEQLGWSDYWTNLTTQMVTGDAYDVFTNHVSRYPGFVEQKQLVDLAPLVARDKVDLSVYYPSSLAPQWVLGSARYGLPKDIGSEAVFYNADALTKAGVNPNIMNIWKWNPKGTGNFENVVAKLSLDKNGNNGLSAKFDKNSVVQYGFAMNLPDWNGQTGWGSLAASNGFKLQDKAFAGKYNYDDPRFLETIDWWKALVAKGYAPPFKDLANNGVGQDALFQAGKVAMMIEGNWNVADLRKSKFKLGFGLLPSGTGVSKTIANGLADSIYAGSKHKEEAWKWVKFLASPACATIVGNSGVVFPAQKVPAQLSIRAIQKSGLDASAFLKQQARGTWAYPIDQKTSEVTAIMGPVLQDYLQDKVGADAVKAAAAKVNALFK
ncbi:ABC transporter substrate-binding protein [Deinococcus sp.]|uniref:ABC transporter substrate-binding protein n=1 Tax=Deinococcus sp. TaxID=47478 RepID=UPI003CC56178